MNKLHVNGLPLEITDQELRDLFEQVGPVASVKVCRRVDGQCIGLGIVEMCHAQDVEDILHSKDRLAIGGIQPHIWKPDVSAAGNLIKSRYHGVHIGECKQRWLVFELSEGRLLWCRNFEDQAAAMEFHRWLHIKRRNQSVP